jgi:organic hydroperoxide reductase OsmC/OhrA
MMGEHHYSVQVLWTGNRGQGTSGYKDYDRSHTIKINNKPDILGSSDAPFQGDVTRHNPEDMLLTALSTCHMLWYLHLCADAGIIVTGYTDNATGTMIEVPGGGGHFTSVTLHPVVTITDAAKTDLALALHDKAHAKCFIASSVNFPVGHQPRCSIHP